MQAYRQWQDPGIKVYAGGKPTMDLIGRLVETGRFIAQTASPDVLEVIYNSMRDGTPAVLILPEGLSQNQTAGRLQRKGARMEYVPHVVEERMSPPRHQGLWHDVVSRENSAVYSPAHRPGKPAAITFEIVDPDYAANLFDTCAMLVEDIKSGKPERGLYNPVENIVGLSSLNRHQKDIFNISGGRFVYTWMGRIVHVSDEKRRSPPIALTAEDGLPIDVDLSKVASSILETCVRGPPAKEEQVPTDRYESVFA